MIIRAQPAHITGTILSFKNLVMRMSCAGVNGSLGRTILGVDYRESIKVEVK